MQGIDPATPTWRALRKAIEARIEDCRNRLEVSQSLEITERVRGQISALRALIEDFDPPVREGATEDEMIFKDSLY